MCAMIKAIKGVPGTCFEQGLVAALTDYFFKFYYTPSLKFK